MRIKSYNLVSKIEINKPDIRSRIPGSDQFGSIRVDTDGIRKDRKKTNTFLGTFFFQISRVWDEKKKLIGDP